MVYRQPYYFLGQQDSGLPLKRKSQSVLDCSDRRNFEQLIYRMISPSSTDRGYSRASPRLYVSSPSPQYPPSPPQLPARTSPSRFGSTKRIWIDKKTGRVVDGPDILKGERLIRFDNTSNSDSDFSSSRRSKHHITLEDHSPHQSPRRMSKSPPRQMSPSPPPRAFSSYRRTSPTRATYNKFESPARRRPARHYSPSYQPPRDVPCSYITGSDSSSSSTPLSDSSSKYFHTETSESETSTSSGYDSGALDWRQYHNARRLSPSTGRSQGKIITLSPRRSGSPLRNLVPHQHNCGGHRSRCLHRGCHKRCEHCRALGCRQSVSRRSRATTRVVREKPSSNLSFFEETILPGPNMPLKHFTPVCHSESETSSESEYSYYGPLRHFMHNSAYKQAHGRGRLNDNLEKWLNDAMKSTYSPPVGSNYDICWGRAI